ncbi:hypothetical protein BSKO_01943 [Bryopsis sp. KO-2023]|nr:hypothetical protein BSKO_01943 [Bryopsis sp. KO-2023]
MAYRPTKPTLFDVPVSPYGARVRYLIYSKGLESTFQIQSPKELGGLKSAEYKALHPFGKMPMLVLPDGLALPESEVISQYICDRYKDVGPDFVPADPEKRAKASWVTRLHDLYLTPIQGAMYKEMGVEERADKIRQIRDLLDVFEDLIEGPFVLGGATSTADAALFPSFCFLTFMLPSVFGWEDVFKGRPKLKKWWEAMGSDVHAARVMEEVNGALQEWREGGRWTTINEQVKDTNYQWTY